MPISSYLKQELLSLSLAGIAVPPTTERHLGLFTGDPLADGSGPELPVLNNYARAALVTSVPVMAVSQNTMAISFSAAGSDWGMITHVGVFDSAIAGNMLFFQELTFPRNILDADILEFAVGSIQFR